MCHLELDPVWPGLTASCMQSEGAQLSSGHVDGGGGGGRYQSLPTGPDKMQQVKQSSHWGLGDQLDKTIFMHL